MSTCIFMHSGYSYTCLSTYECMKDVFLLSLSQRKNKRFMLVYSGWGVKTEIVHEASDWINRKERFGDSGDDHDDRYFFS